MGTATRECNLFCAAVMLHNLCGRYCATRKHILFNKWCQSACMREVKSEKRNLIPSCDPRYAANRHLSCPHLTRQRLCLVQFNQYPTIWWLSVVNLYFETETAPILPCWRRKDLHGIYHLFLAEVSWCLAEQSRVAAGQDSAAPPPGASSLHLKTWVWARNSPAPCHLTWPAAAEPATTSMWTPQPRVSRTYWSSHCQFTGVEVTEVTYQWPVYWLLT